MTESLTRDFKDGLTAGETVVPDVPALGVAFTWGTTTSAPRKVLQPNIGSGVSALVALVSTNPVASPLSRTMVYTAAAVRIGLSEPVARRLGRPSPIGPGGTHRDGP